MADGLTIAHVTPHPWGRHHEVNHFIERSAAELRDRGHRVVIAAPSESRASIRASRAAIKDARADDRAILGRAWQGERIGGGRDDVPVVAIGQAIPLPRGPRARPAAVSFDPGRALEEMLSAVRFDVVHVHDPFTPSASASALRHSWALNVGTFHEPTERILSTQVARPLVEIFLGRLDARTSTSEATTSLMRGYFPGDYEPLAAGSDPDAKPAWPFAERDDGTVRILFPSVEERGALRLFLRAIRKLTPEHPWEAVIWSDGPHVPLRLARSLAGRIRQAGPRDGTLDELIAAADVVCLASGTGGADMAPGVIRQTLATRSVPVVSQLGSYRELVGDGERGLTFAPGDALTLAAHLESLASNHALRSAFADAAPVPHTWTDVAGELETLYERVVARRHDTSGDVVLRRKVSRRREIHVDLHMHTDHSHDCATPVEVLLETAKDRGLGAIAITDHNEVSGAFAAVEAAERIGGIKVIVAEEVKTANQGEVIGLFLREKIERGMTMAETVAEIKRQGGLVYVPHPFDRLHSVPDYEHLLAIVEDVDILEVFNPRVAFGAFNDEAERFATKYGIVAGAGSDAHVAQALGSVKIRLHDFEGPEEFLESMRSADIVRKHRNIAYVQMLKWMQTAGGTGGRRRSVPDAQPARGGNRRALRRAARRQRTRGKS